MLTREAAPDPAAAGDDDEIAGILAALHPGSLVEIAERDPSWQICLNHLMGAQVPYWRAGRQVDVGWLVELVSEPARFDAEVVDGAAQVLTQHGLRLWQDLDKEGRPAGPKCLAVANQHPGLNRLFQGTRWESSASGTGVWRQAMLRVEGAQAGKAKMRFHGVQQRAVLVPIEQIMGID